MSNGRPFVLRSPFLLTNLCLGILLEGQAFSDDFAGLQIFIGREIKENRLQGLIVDLACLSQMLLLHIGVVNSADEALKSVCIVDIHHRALHCQGRLADPT